MSYYKDQKFHTKKYGRKVKENKFSMALFYQVQFKAGYQPFVSSLYAAVDSGRLKATCDH